MHKKHFFIFLRFLDPLCHILSCVTSFMNAPIGQAQKARFRIFLQMYLKGFIGNIISYSFQLASHKAR